MAAEKARRRHTVAPGVEDDVLQRHGTRLNDVNLASRKAEEASLRRHEAAWWLRKMIGVVGGKDLAVEPSEDEFRVGLRSGIILCNVLNKLQPGAVPKVVEGAGDSDVMADGAALSAYQYFENVRNFLMAAQEMGLPTFEASDLEEEGNCGRIVNCVLALKSYSEWIEGGKHGSWKYGGNARPPASGKPFLRKNSEQSINSLSRTVSSSSATDLSVCGDLGCDYIEGGSPRSLNSLLREHLSDKKPEEVPIVVESLLSKFMEQLERRMATQQEATKIGSGDKAEVETEDSIQEAAAEDKEMEEMEDLRLEQEECDVEKSKFNSNKESSRQQLLKQQRLVEQQNKEIQELKKLIHHTKTGIHSLKERYHQDLTNLSYNLQGLASAASAYHRVVEENRKLYNQLQDLKGNIRVYCRVRPLLGRQSNQVSTVSNMEEGSVSVITTPAKKGKKIFSFNRMFGPTATQEEVFSDTQPLIRSVLDGYNVCIFAYGQTGSGKTYTMSGPDDLKEENVGVNYRALRDLFLLSGQRKDTFRYEIAVQMLEIYNDQVRDLLATDGATSTTRLEIRKSGQNGINVPDANLVPVSSTSDVIYLMNMGQKNRAVGAAAMNDRSSRSHSCLTVYVEGREATSGSIVRGCMHLVDLAGSERVDKSEATGDRLKEAQHINKSLSALGDVISSLSQNNSHVPYRNSKLTQLLQHSLGGQAKILMFVHISPEPEALDETISTLKFAERVSTVRLGALRANKDSTDVRELKEQIARLKAALSRKEKEAEQLRHYQIPRPRSYGSSPKQASWIVGGRTKPRDDHDSCSLDGHKKATTKLKRRSLDLQEMNMNSNAWPLLVGGHRVNGKEEDKVSICGDWVDNFTLKRQDSLSSDDNLVGQWEAESKQFSQICLERSLKVTPKKEDRQGYDDLQMNLNELVVTDDCDELEVATSDSSESDLNWLVDMPKATRISDGSWSKAKKVTQPIQIKNPQIRSAIPSSIPLPSRKEEVAARPKRRSSPTKAEAKTRPGRV